VQAPYFPGRFLTVHRGIYKLLPCWWKRHVTENRRCLAIFRSDKAFRVALALKAFLNPRSRPTHGGRLAVNRHKKQAEKLKNARQRLKEERKKNKKQAAQLKAAGQYKKGQRKKHAEKDQEIFRLKNELRAAKEKLESASDNRAAPQMAVGSTTGALPDFVIIGAMKCGTSTLYSLLSEQHPHVESAATKELSYFDLHFDRGVEWYRSQFPSPRWKDGRRSITGEATPNYLPNPSVPERMAQEIPQARLIVLLRNPIDRAYSHYHHRLNRWRETRSFEKAIIASIEAEKTQPPDHFGYLSRGIYVDQLVSWSRFFNEEQMLVLKSEDFFERPQEIMKLVWGFLDLPDWEFSVARARQRKGCYEQQMDPAIRVRLQDYFEPHNQRLYEYLGVDFGW
jgi:hypothetical protein